MRLPPYPLGEKKKKNKHQEKGVGDSRQRNIGGEDEVKIEAEAGVMWTSANKRLASPGVGKGRKEVPGGSRALPRS